MMIYKLIPTLALSLVVLLFACNDQPKPVSGKQPAKGTLFTLLPSDETGIDFSNDLVEDATTERNVLSYSHYYNGGGVAIGDVNNDGWPDVFLTGNEVPNRLYLNKGNMQFEDVSEKAGVNPPNKHWSTGASMVDINNDGFLDIYICQYGPHPPAERENLFLINNGDGTFTEKGAELGLNDPNESMQAAFFDYDKDGDLDCYVMNESKYALVVYQKVFEDLKNKDNLRAASGKMFRNDDGHFTDVTEQAGMLRYGYGLGLTVSDIDQDGWLDVYVANDYSVPDFMYINNGDGTFTDKIKEKTRQVSFYGMGCDIADYNNDCLPEIAVVDMASIDHFRSKTLMASMDTEGFWYFINDLGYQYQYMFNTFQLNNGNGTFSNVANLAGVAKSDWSWAALLADFDNDGWKDYFISTGFRRYARDNDFRNEMKAIRQANGGTVPLSMRQKMYDKMPQIQLPNFIYKNNKDLTFKEITQEWGMAKPSYSNGAAYADLDADGDLDLITNNIDHPAFVYKNNAVEMGKGNYLRVKLNAESPASLTGAKVTIYAGGQKQYLEAGPIRGYMGCMDRVLHFGLGSNQQVDRLVVEWLNGTQTELTGLPANQLVEVNQKDARPKPPAQPAQKSFPIVEVNPHSLGIGFRHRENPFNDFAKQVLLPHKQSTLGPKVSVGDANGDGLDDFFVGGASGQAGALYVQNPDGSFTESTDQPWQKADLECEDMDAAFFDADGDGDLDLYVVSGGGGDMEGKEKALQDRIYINLDGKGRYGKANALPDMPSTGFVVKTADFDKDGDQDIFVGGGTQPGRYPYASRSYLLRFDRQRLKYMDVTAEVAPDLENPGLVKDAVWTDLNNDGFPDLVVVGEWMPVGIYINNKGRLENRSAQYGTDNLKGWWYSIAAADIDNDGDEDFIVGNLGENGKFHATAKKPFRVFASDFDKNGTCDVVLSKEYKGKLVPTRGRQCSSEQMPFIKEKFPTFKDFANAGVEDILGKENLNAALKLEVTTFSSVLLINNGDTFAPRHLPNEAQIAPVNGIICDDFDNDGNKDLLIAGNNFDAEVETPRYDAGTGLVLKGDGTGHFQPVLCTESGFYAPQNIKDVAMLRLAGTRDRLVLLAVNNSSLEVFRVRQKDFITMNTNH
ncbi:MAG TPA: hypothetical protein ENJ20_02010 [Bacteroidetes bacterium]|nr:hypothetical protein [Bacteroidota bacterium]